MYAATSRRVYAHTLPTALIERIFGENADGGAFAIDRILRKLYSIVAFTLIGFVFHQALPPSRHPALRAALMVGAFSLVIEIVQKLHHAREGPLSNLIDIACGALGGWLAVTITENVKNRRPMSP